MKAFNSEWYKELNIRIVLNSCTKESQRFYSLKCTKAEGAHLFVKLFSEDDLKEVIIARQKMLNAEYAKIILKASDEGDMEEFICAVAIMFIQEVSHKHDFITERLVGKKLSALWGRIKSKYEVTFISAEQRLLECCSENVFDQLEDVGKPNENDPLVYRLKRWARENEKEIQERAEAFKRDHGIALLW